MGVAAGYEREVAIWWIEWAAETVAGQHDWQAPLSTSPVPSQRKTTMD